MTTKNTRSGCTASSYDITNRNSYYHQTTGNAQKKVNFQVIQDFNEIQEFKPNYDHFIYITEKQEKQKFREIKLQICLQNSSDHQKIDKLLPDYARHVWCCERMKKGIQATKFSFNSPCKFKVVQLKLSKDGRFLSYSDQEMRKDFFGMYFTFPRYFRLDKIKGFTYGAESYTFRYLRKLIVKKSQELRISEIEACERMGRFDGR